MIVAVGATAIFGLRAVRSWPRSPLPPAPERGAPAESMRRTPGVVAELRADDVEIVRTLPALAFRLAAGQTLDERLPAGVFAGTFEVTFDPGRVRRATFGADVQGGQLIVRRGGVVLLSAYAGARPARVWPTADVAPTTLGRERATITFEFTATGPGPHALRALWRPEHEIEPRPLPTSGAPLVDDPALRGRILAQSRNCAACHPSRDPALQTRLTLHPGPPLGDAGRRVRPAWLECWLRDPAAVAPGTRMPRIRPPAGTDESSWRQNLAHYVRTLGGPLAGETAEIDRAAITTGRELYHEVGCVACHGPREPSASPPGGAASGSPWRLYVAIGDPAAKTTVASLAAYLADPRARHPGSLMPDLGLDAGEAEAIAAYLIAGAPGLAPAPGLDPGPDPGPGPGPGPGPAPTPARASAAAAADPVRAARGRRHFTAAGCAACHAVPEGAGGGTAPARASPLESLATGAAPLAAGDERAGRGCLAPTPPRAAPDFGLRADQRRDLAAFLVRLARRRSDDAPLDALAMDLRRLRCTACHAYQAWPGPEQALTPHFRTRGEPGDGPLPPDLTNAGARLTPAALRDLLAGDRRTRPHLATRMPRYADAIIDPLPARFSAAAGPEAE